MSDLARLLQQYGYGEQPNALARDGESFDTSNVLAGMPKPNPLANALRVAMNSIPENKELPAPAFPLDPRSLSMANMVRGGLDTAASWLDYQNKPQPNDYKPSDVFGPLGAGFMGSMFAPKNALGIFGGRLAKTADHNALAKAEEMASKGADRRAIWDETGWFQGADGKWRFEIPDNASTYHDEAMRPHAYSILGKTVMGRQGVAGDVLQHPELMAAYPDIATMKFAKTNYPDGRLGQYDQGGGPLKLDEYVGLNMEAPMFAGHDTVLHELQHAVQQREGFAKGANPAQFRDQQTPNPAYVVFQDAAKSDPVLQDVLRFREAGEHKKALDEVNRIWNDEFKGRIDDLDAQRSAASREDYVEKIKPLYDALFAESEARSRVAVPAFARYEDQMRDLRARGIPREIPKEYLTPDAAYRASAGEVEARNVQTRQKMTPDERRAKPPWMTEDIPALWQIFDKTK